MKTFDFRSEAQLMEAVKQGNPNFSVWSITAIQAGMSLNQTMYTKDALREAVNAGVFNGIQITDRDIQGHMYGPAGGNGIQYNIGVTKNATFDEASGEVRCEAWLQKEAKTTQKIEQFFELAKDDPALRKAVPGFSIRGAAETSIVIDNNAGTAYRNVSKLTRVHTLDVVPNPAAGGRVLDKVAASESEGSSDMDAIKAKLAWLQKTAPTLYSKLNQSDLKESEVDALVMEAMKAQSEEQGKKPESIGSAVSESKTDDAALRAAIAKLAESQDSTSKLIAGFLKTAQRDTRLSQINAKLVESTTLPTATRDKLRSQFTLMLDSGVAVTDEMVESAIQLERTTLAESIDQVIGRGTGFSFSGPIDGGMSEADKLGLALQRMFFIDSPDSANIRVGESEKEDWKGVAPFRSINAAVRMLTGRDPVEMFATGDGSTRFKIPSQVYNHSTGLFESHLTTDVPALIRDAIHKQMLREWSRPELLDWRNLVKVSSVSDLKDNYRLRLGGFGDLPDVAERAAYTDLGNVSEEELNFSITKRGGTVDITLEMILEDDMRQILSMPKRMALADQNTIRAFVEAFLIDNSTIWDSTALFTTGHANKGTAVLSKESLFAGWLAMKSQTETVSTTGEGSTTKKLNYRPKILLVDASLLQDAYEILSPSFGQPNGTPGFTQTLGLTVFELLYQTANTTTWYLMADPKLHDTLEIAFLGGKQEPDLYVQRDNSNGMMFTNDVMTFKIRHFWGGAVTEYRTMYAGIPA